MKTLLLFGALALSINSFGQETLNVDTKTDFLKQNLYGYYETEFDSYYIGKSDSADFSISYDAMGRGGRILMSCSGEGVIGEGQLLVIGHQDDECWDDEPFEISFTEKDGVISLMIGEYSFPKN